MDSDDDEIDETEFDFRRPGGVNHLVESAIKELREAEPTPAPPPPRATPARPSSGPIARPVDMLRPLATPAILEFPKPKPQRKEEKRPDSRDVPTQFVDAQQASIDRAIASSLLTGEQARGEIPMPPPTFDPDAVAALIPLEGFPPPPQGTPLQARLPMAPQRTPPPEQKVILGIPDEPELALDIEVLASRPARTPVHLPPPPPLFRMGGPEVVGLPKAFWVAAFFLTLIVLGYMLLR